MVGCKSLDDVCTEDNYFGGEGLETGRRKPTFKMQRIQDVLHPRNYVENVKLLDRLNWPVLKN